MIDKIQVLLIDDNPSFALTKIAHIPEYETLPLRPNQKEKKVPYIEDIEVREAKHLGAKVLSPDLISFNNEKIELSKRLRSQMVEKCR